MTAIRFDIHDRKPYATGDTFGDFGAFEHIEGRIEYAVAPDHAANRPIVDLDLAPREPDGRVAFAGDFTIVAPVSRPARAVLLDVPNRGRRLPFSQFNRAAPADLLADPCAPGDGFLFRRGFALASVGWQWDATEGLALDAPRAEPGGRPARGEVVCRVQPDRDTTWADFGQLGEVSYLPADLEDPDARLFVQRDDNGPYELLPRADWRFARERRGRVVPDGTAVHVADGMRAGTIYTLVYAAEGAPVVGTGLLALRDAATALRTADGVSPLAYGFDRVHAFGASQTGRVLRHFLFLGLNRDERGVRAFDGVLAHIAGGQRGDFNHRFAQPSSLGAPGPGQAFPFAGAAAEDPHTGRTAGLFDAETDLPKVFFTNTSWEYWRGDAALVHVDPGGAGDLPEHPSERRYAFAGTHHVNGILPLTDTFPLTGTRGRYTFNVVDHSPLVRAALVNLDRWAAGAAEPPPSAVPRLADGSLVERGDVLGRFESTLGLRALDEAQLGGLSHLDLGPDAAHGVCRFPGQRLAPFPRLVSEVGPDLNEVAGIRLPDVSVPVGVHTGWNPRHPAQGAPRQAAAFAGFSRFFDAGALADRYGTREAYAERARAAARALIETGYALEEDEELLVRNALTRYDIALERDAGSA